MDGGTAERSQCIQQGSWCLIREECPSWNITVKSRINDLVSSSSPVLETSWLSFSPGIFFPCRKSETRGDSADWRCTNEGGTTHLPAPSLFLPPLAMFFLEDWIHLEFCLKKPKKKQNPASIRCLLAAMATCCRSFVFPHDFSL